ncbi:MAG: MBL fold metallo-hydrolase [Deltaproteobacteria bacterium]|jgi:glyoxylase-like metal-dependent hydrolase (beta-lactamase superfamily II)|nr:MBL fold metallo-hydrolase [Deltaproteobacteria bacterium]
MIIEQVQVGHFAVFAYLVGCPETGEGIVIDPADQVGLLLEVAKNRKIEKIKYIVNTHCHADHAGGNREMKERTKAQIVIHKNDAERLANPSSLALQIFQCEASPPADLTVEEGDRIEFGQQFLEVIHTPGHTPGGMSLYTNGYVFTGDTLFVGGIGRTDLPGGSMPQLLLSIKTKLLTLPEDTLVFPGHNYGTSPQSTIGKEKQYNPFVR